MFRNRVRIDLSRISVFEFTTQVQELMKNTCIEESVVYNAKKFRSFIAENQNTNLSYRDIYDYQVLRTHDDDIVPNFRLRVFHEFKEDEVLALVIGDFRDVLMTLPNVHDGRTYPIEEIGSRQEFNRIISNGFTIDLPYGLNTYADCAAIYDSEDIEFFGRVAFDREELFKSAAVNAFFDYFKEHDIEILHRMSNYNKILNFVEELHIENPYYINIPEYETSKLLSDEKIQIIQGIDIPYHKYEELYEKLSR